MPPPKAPAPPSSRGTRRTPGSRRFPPSPSPWTSTILFPSRTSTTRAELGESAAGHDRETLALALARGDFFLCASADQRLFYAGALYAAGRIGARNYPGDPGLSRLLAVVPFGVPDAPAAGDRARGRAAAGVPSRGPLILFGGIYDWYEPDLLLEAWPRVRASFREARLLFFENPNPQTTPQRAMERARERARLLDPAGDSIFFSRWLPYAERADLYAAADVAVSIAAEGLETDLSYRTRLLDAAWGGVPSVTVGGGAVARELEQSGAARRASFRPEELAPAIAEVIASRDRFAAAARRFASERTWGRVARPLADWCREPSIDPGRRPFRGETARPLWRRLWEGAP